MISFNDVTTGMLLVYVIYKHSVFKSTVYKIMHSCRHEIIKLHHLNVINTESKLQEIKNDLNSQLLNIKEDVNKYKV